MKKVFITTLVLLPIFGILFILLFRPVKQAYYGLLAQPVSLCTGMKYRDFYNSLRKEKDYVIFKGYLYGGKVLLFSDYDVNNCEESIVEIEVDEEMNKSIALRYPILELVKELRNYSDEEKDNLRVEVILHGILIENKSTSSPKYRIQVVTFDPIGTTEKVNRNELLRK